MKESILVLASSCWCTMIYTHQGLRTWSTIGCMGPGKALNFHKLGVNTTLHTLLGNDQPGERVRSRLLSEGVNLIVDVDPAGTNTHINIMDDRGNRQGVPIITPSREPILDLPRLESLVKGHSLVALNVNNHCRQAIPFIKKYHQRVWCDLGDYEPGNPYFDDFYEVATHVTMSGSKLMDPMETLRTCIKDGKALAVVTLAEKGSLAMTAQGELISNPALRCRPLVDSNGAGDSFFAGLVYGVHSGHSLVKSLQLANIMGSLTISSQELVHPNLSPELLDQEWTEHHGQPAT